MEDCKVAIPVVISVPLKHLLTMKNVFFLAPLLFLVTACDYDYKIESLENRIIPYDSLPSLVQERLIEASSQLSSGSAEGVIPSPDLIVVNKEDASNYETEVVWNPIVSAWVRYIKLFDNKENIYYKINRETPQPYIIYNKNLYIPDDYNILLSGGGNVTKPNFTEYHLK